MGTAIRLGRALGGISAAMLLLAGCAQTPMGPTVQVMPGPGKSFGAFQADNEYCKSYAASQVQGQADNANQRAVGAAALSTALGVGAGALIGSVSGNAGAGAAIGGAAGLGVGTGIGAGNSQNAQYSIQQQYDNAFSQCMYSKGHQVAGYAPASPPPPPPVAYGPDPALVRATQNELIRLHYLDDVADGAMGPKTSRAISAFERADGLPVDGTVSQRLLARLQATPTGAGPAASAPNWVAPTTGTSTPASAPAAPSGWVAPKSP